MEDGDDFEPSKPDAIGRSWDAEDAPFKVWSNYGHGEPHYYVCLDVGESGDNSWHFDPDQAETLGIRLQEFARWTRQKNVEEEERLRRLPEGGWTNGPPSP